MRFKEFTDAEISASLPLVNLGVGEDLGSGDRTSQAIIPENLIGSAIFVSRSSGVLAGLPAVEEVIQAVAANLFPWPDPKLPAAKYAAQMPTAKPCLLDPILHDGNALHHGDEIAKISGPLRTILGTERTALNFLQHLSGIATLTWRFVEATKGLPCRIFDTRKTLPGWRLLEKYAVRCGGGFNHRMGLYDGVLIKDNHLAALGGGADAIRHSIQLAREKNAPDVPVEIEVENLELLEVALACRPDIVLLDNMSLDQLKEAVRRRNEKARQIQLEASGGITLDNVRAVAETGVDRISVGALTHSAPALDIALDYEG
ncbi:MAG TPA: carboxylating nicotinate-nucleotide diphosphorylase [Gemmataceae bacterium]|jgi:nicotinate-nucleotide pyrophosphorylase (carboxylating)|nr:carboxylating nicotinate-nucleotide diphosphorylase [Gemmataceae bacterium]